MHLELKLDDSEVMISDSTEDYPAITAILHIYVPDVLKTFDLAITNDCLLLERPVNKADDQDTRGAFLDPSGNYWSVSTQQEL